MVSISQLFVYVPQFIIVPITFNLNLKRPQNKIPMLLRSNFKTKQYLRPVRLVEVPIYYSYQNINQANQDPKRSIFEQNFTKVRIYLCGFMYVYVWINENKMVNYSVFALLYLFKLKWFRGFWKDRVVWFHNHNNEICKQWMLDVVLNRHLEQEATNRKLQNSINKENRVKRCTQFFFIPKKDFYLHSQSKIFNIRTNLQLPELVSE